MNHFQDPDSCAPGLFDFSNHRSPRFIERGHFGLNVINTNHAHAQEGDVLPPSVLLGTRSALYPKASVLDRRYSTLNLSSRSASPRASWPPSHIPDEAVGCNHPGREWLAVHYHIFKQDVFDGVCLVKTLELRAHRVCYRLDITIFAA